VNLFCKEDFSFVNFQQQNLENIHHDFCLTGAFTLFSNSHWKQGIWPGLMTQNICFTYLILLENFGVIFLKGSRIINDLVFTHSWKQSLREDPRIRKFSWLVFLFSNITTVLNMKRINFVVTLLGRDFQKIRASNILIVESFRSPKQLSAGQTRQFFLLLFPNFLCLSFRT
jgi:hypothetical protein